MGRTSTVNVVRIADVVLVVGATEEQVTLLAEVDAEAVDAALRRAPRAGRRPARRPTRRGAGDRAPRWRPAPPAGALAGSVFDRDGWGTFVHQLRERTVRKS